jgi:2-methylcitrate dehydratase PrpD
MSQDLFSMVEWTAAMSERTSSEVLAKAKCQWLDFVSVVLAGRADAANIPVSKGGVIDSPELQAWHLGMLGHCLDYDDTYQLAQIHPSVVIIPALIAGERPGECGCCNSTQRLPSYSIELPAL